MANLPPIPSNLLIQPPSIPNDAWTGRGPRSDLEKLHHHTQTGNHRNSWGLTFYRTTYTPESDTTFPLAIQRIEAYLRSGIRSDVAAGLRASYAMTEAAGEELLARLHNTVIEDRGTLDGASLEAVEAAWHIWVRENGDLGSDNPRYHIALVMDDEAVRDTLELLDPDDARGMPFERFKSTCKALVRWGVDRDMSCQWVWAAPGKLQRLLFRSIDKDAGDYLVEFAFTMIGADPPVYEMCTNWHYFKRGKNKLTGYK